MSELVTEDFGFSLVGEEQGVKVFDGALDFSDVPQKLRLFALGNISKTFVCSDTKELKLGNLSDLNGNNVSAASTIDVGVGLISQVCYNYDESKIYVLGSNGIKFIDSNDKSVGVLIQENDTEVVSCSPVSDATAIIAGGTLQLFHGTTKKMDLLSKAVEASWSSDGQTIYTADNQEVKIFNVSGQMTRSFVFPHIEDASDVAVVNIFELLPNQLLVSFSFDEDSEINTKAFFLNLDSEEFSEADVAVPFGSSERMNYYYFSKLNGWIVNSSLFFVTSGGATDVNAVLKKDDDELYILMPADDSMASTFPMNDAGDDMSPIGMSVDLSNKDVKAENLTNALDEAIGLPKLWVFTQEFSLISWWIFDVKAVKNNSVSLESALNSLVRTASHTETKVPESKQPFGSSSGFGSFPAFGSGLGGLQTKPAFGSSFGSTETKLSFGSTGFGKTESKPTLGSTNFGSTESKPSFGSTSFGTTETKPAFGSTGFGSSESKPAFGSTSFGSSSAAFGSSGFGNSTKGTSGGSGFASFANTSEPLGSTKKENVFGGNGASPFGSGSEADSKPSPFGSLTSRAEIKSSPFGSLTSQEETKPSPFGSLTNKAETKSSPFGSLTSKADSKPSPFGSLTNKAETKPSPFGSLTNKAETKPSPFGSVSGNPSISSPFSNLKNDPNTKPSPLGGSKSPSGGLKSISTEVNPSPFGSSKPESKPSAFGSFKKDKEPDTKSPFGSSLSFGSLKIDDKKETTSSIFSSLKKEPAEANPSSFVGSKIEEPKPTDAPFGNLTKSSNLSFANMGEKKEPSTSPFASLTKPSTLGAASIDNHKEPSSSPFNFGSTFDLKPAGNTTSGLGKTLGHKKTDALAEFGSLNLELNKEPAKQEAPRSEPSEKDLGPSDDSQRSDSGNDSNDLENDFNDSEDDAYTVYEPTHYYFGGLTRDLKSTNNEILDMIDQILNNVRGNMEVLSVNEEELHNAFDAHLCAEDWDSSEVTTALDHEMPLRLGMIRQIRQLLKDTSNETSSSLKEIRQQWSHFEKLDKSTEELLMTKYQIQKAIIQLQMFADESHNPSDLARYSALDYRSTQLQKSIRTKLQTVNNLKDQLISQMMPLKARVQGTELSVEKVKELLFQLNALISDKTTVVDELAAKLAKTKLQQPKEPRALSLTAAKAPSARWHVGQQINLRPKFISLQKLE